MAMNFPTPASPGDIYTSDNGITYTYDGVKWVGTVAGAGSYTDANVSALLAQGAVVGNLSISENTIYVANDGGEIILQPDGTGNVYIGGPGADNNLVLTSAVVFPDGTQQITAPTSGIPNWTVDPLTSALLPNTDNLQDIGSPTNRVRHVYVGPGSITVGDSIISESTTGKLVIPGLTRGTGYSVEEVDDTSDQSYVFGSAPTIIDAALYNALINSQSDLSYFASFNTQLDGDGYIDNIDITSSGNYPEADSVVARSNNMYAYIGSGDAGARPANPQEWVQIPFRPRLKASDTEYEFSTGGNANTGDITFDGVDISATDDQHVNIVSTEYVQLESNDNYIWVDNSGVHVEIAGGGTNQFGFFYDSEGSAKPVLQLPEGGDIVDSAGVSVLGGGSGLADRLTNGDYNLILGTDGNISLPYGVNIESQSGGDAGTIIAVTNTDSDNAIAIQNKKAEDGTVLSSLMLDSNGTSGSLKINIKDTVTGGETNKNWFFWADGVFQLPEGGDIVDSNYDSVLNGGAGLPDRLTNSGYNVILESNGTLTLAGDIQADSINGVSFIRSIYSIDIGSQVYVNLDLNVFGDPAQGQVLIDGVVGTTEINGTWYYQATEVNQFTLYTDDTYSTLVDGSAWTAYNYGGYAKTISRKSLQVLAENTVITNGDTSWSFNNTGTLSLPAQGLVFPNGSYIKQQGEEGLVLWQTETGADENDAEYVALWYGGDGANDDPKVSITAGTYNFAVDDCSLEYLNYTNDGASQGPYQINFDIVVDSNTDTVLNWHLDTSGNLYLPAHPSVAGTSGIVFADGTLQTTAGGGDSIGNLIINNNTNQLSFGPGESASFLYMKNDGSETRLANDFGNVQISVINQELSQVHHWTFSNIAGGGLVFPDNTVQTTAYTGADNGITIANTAPAGNNGKLWFNTTDARTYIKYDGAYVDTNPAVIPLASTYTGELVIEETTISNSDYTGVKDIVVENGGKSWKFTSAGEVVFPDNTVQTTAYVEAPILEIDGGDAGTWA